MIAMATSREATRLFVEDLSFQGAGAITQACPVTTYSTELEDEEGSSVGSNP